MRVIECVSVGKECLLAPRRDPRLAKVPFRSSSRVPATTCTRRQAVGRASRGMNCWRCARSPLNKTPKRKGDFPGPLSARVLRNPAPRRSATSSLSGQRRHHAAELGGPPRAVRSVLAPRGRRWSARCARPDAPPRSRDAASYRAGAPLAPDRWFCAVGRSPSSTPWLISGPVFSASSAPRSALLRKVTRLHARRPSLRVVGGP